ncbi:DUF4347 domain-containing protein [Flavobacterium longum]|uniref:hypothetical protein n=1 Tax=Flavobacterium longum TaxID=1299340 RepID=UPI0039E895A6
MIKVWMGLLLVFASFGLAELDEVGVFDESIGFENEKKFENTSKVIHIIVALCDNKYQGIVPVGAKIGNGQDPDNNLYWGCAYGIRSYFKKSAEWKFLKVEKKKGNILERIYFQHKTKDVYLIADAYDGQFIKKATEDFLAANAGSKKETVDIDGKSLGIYGHAQLVSYIGHDGLMDFTVDSDYKNVDGKQRDCIILACMSRNFFKTYIKNANSRPLVWTTQLMAPEAYTIHDAISGWLLGETPKQIHTRAAKAYAKYQKCSIAAASKLLVTGF